MKKRSISLLLAVGIACTLLSGTVMEAQAGQSPAAFAGGAGTREDPYLISTPEQLNAIRQGLDKHYKLTNDIDLSAWGNWTPIGGEALDHYGDPAPFTGSFDGTGHVVSSMTITGSIGDYRSGEIAEQQSPTSFGLFGCVRGREEKLAPGDAYEDATLNGVQNLGIVNSKIDLNTEQILGVSYVGAVAGEVENACIANCWSSGGSIQVTANCYTGGIVGGAQSSAIRECWNNSSVSIGAENMGMRTGGIAGESRNTWFSHCFNAGSVSGDQACGISLSLITGSNGTDKKDQSAILYCYNSGAISGDLAVGVGVANVMDNVYNAGTLTGRETSPIYNGAGLGTAGVKISHSGERFLTDENWTISPTLNRKVLTALREDELIAANTAVKGVDGFTDVLSTDYFANAVKWAVGRKITNGTTTNTFSPNNTCTKAEALTFLYRAEGEPPHVPPSDQTVREAFDETNDGWFFAYYYESSCWAYNQGMITPTTGLNSPCTRGDFVTYLWRAAGSPKAGATGQFSDVPAGAPYAHAVAWAVGQGITTGTSGNTFSPDMTCTRGQIVTFLYRAYKNMK